MTSPSQREQAIRNFVEQAWNQGNVSACDAVYSSRAAIHNPSFPVDGVEGLKRLIREQRDAQPDLHVDVENVVVGNEPDSTDGDYTVLRYTLSGTAQSAFQGLPATGKSYVMTGITMDRWEDDKIVEEYVTFDLVGALQQLEILSGITPAKGLDHTQTQTQQQRLRERSSGN